MDIPLRYELRVEDGPTFVLEGVGTSIVPTGEIGTSSVKRLHVGGVVPARFDGHPAEARFRLSHVGRRLTGTIHFEPHTLVGTRSEQSAVTFEFEF